MTYGELIKALDKENASIYIDRIFSRKWRLILKKLFGLVSLASFITSLFGRDSGFDGLALLFLSLFLLFSAFEAFYNSSKFSNSKSRLEKVNNKIGAEYAVALSVFNNPDTDITAGFIYSLPGQILLFRLGVTSDKTGSFFKSDRTQITDFALNFEENFVTFADYAKTVYAADKSLQSFLSSCSISTLEFNLAADWIGHEFNIEIESERWWRRDNLESIPSVGLSLDYGTSYELSKYGSPLYYQNEISSIDISNGYRKKETSQLENILVRREESNAVIIDDDESVAKDIVLRVLASMRSGKASFAIENKNIIELSWNDLVAEKKNKTELQAEIMQLFRGADKAGNLIIYIPNLPSFMANTANSGLNLASVLEEFLNSRSLQIIAHSTKADFHYFIETNSTLIRMFERIIPEEEGVEASMPVLLEKIRGLEFRNKIFFTYPALYAIAESAERFVTYGEMPSKAIDLLVEITPWAVSKGINILMKEDVSIFVSAKTGIVSGKIGKQEGERLEKLEQILHERIVGQEEAVSSISSAMRRARSGITNPERPFASFLFLGPTGVGKTETSKTLAENFFGGEERIIRFDMSEYNDLDALPTLLGSNSMGKSGILASKLRDNPYGVLLLDEFEKASPDVRDLFLSILDEGEFTDALGNKVNCKNLIIIATSNAGSDTIWKMVEENLDLNVNKQKIIDEIISQKILKPELINRFDGVIIFHPLQTTELDKVAEMMFQKLKDRIREEKNIEIEMAPSLLSHLVSVGSGKEFGARSINRLMQEKVEDFVARKIISGEAKAGSILEITEQDVLG